MKAYVGMTSKTPEKRLRRHKQDARSGRGGYLYNAIRQYGEDKFEVVLLDTAKTEEKAYQLEKEWIARLGTFNDWGYNLTVGGDGVGSGKDHPMAGATGKDNPMYGKTGKDHPGYGRTGAENPMYGKTGEDHPAYGKRIDISGEDNPNTTLSRKEAGEVKYLALEGDLTQEKIAEKYGITSQTVSNIKVEKGWSDLKPQKP
jgi:hypothetical protein